jgi:glyoxylase-like metal-dependent hydrolase (beta-lactamase superfamily II)
MTSSFGSAPQAATRSGPPAEAAKPAPAITLHTLVPGKLYWAEGDGGNSGIVVGDKGVVVIDAKMTPAGGRAMIAAIAKVTPKPITHVVLTHSDGDHVNGLAGFPDGLKIIAHKNNKLELQAVYQFAAVEIGGGRCLPPANRLPNTIIFKNQVSTVIDGVRFIFHHFGPAHTNGDLVVELPDYSIAFTGDIITSIVLVHPEKNGSFENWFRTAQDLLNLNVKSYLGGHSPGLDTKESLRKRIADYQAVKAKVDTLMDSGKSLSEIKVAMGVPAQDPSGCRGVPYLSLPNIEFNERSDRLSELK